MLTTLSCYKGHWYLKGAGVWKRCLEKIIEVLTVWVPETLIFDINVGASIIRMGQLGLGVHDTLHVQDC